MSYTAFLVEYPIYTGSSVAYRITTYRRRKSGFFLKILPVKWQDFLFWFGRKLKSTNFCPLVLLSYQTAAVVVKYLFIISSRGFFTYQSNLSSNLVYMVYQKSVGWGGGLFFLLARSLNCPLAEGRGLRIKKYLLNKPCFDGGKEGLVFSS